MFYFFKFDNVFVIFLLSCLLGCIYKLIFDIDIQKCAMTYMFEYPKFQRYNLEIQKNKSFMYYGLFHYSEGDDVNRFYGVPVLFIPGNSGSYKQVRSLASVSRQMSFRKDNGLQKFDYFSIDLNEELSAFNGDIILRQIEFVSAAIIGISNIYKDKRPLILIGHSMGGFLARAVLSRKEISVDVVRLILALSSPLETCVYCSDNRLVQLYENVNEFWRANDGVPNVPVISITGGNRDLLVWDGFGRVLYAAQSLWLPTTSVNNCLASTDHLCIVWCRQLMLAINRGFYAALSGVPGLLVSNSSLVFQSLKDHLTPKLSTKSNMWINSTTSSSYVWLLAFGESVDIIGNDDVFRFVVSGLYWVTRPVRLNIISKSECADSKVLLASLISKFSGHVYHYEIQTDDVLLVLAESVPHSEAPVVEFSTIDNCHYTIRISASLFDWAVQLLRIHLGKCLGIVSCLTVLTYSMNFLATICSVVLVVFISLISALCGFGNITQLFSLMILDVFDLLFIFMLFYPVTWLINSVCTCLAHATRAIPKCCSSRQCMLTIYLLIIPIAVSIPSELVPLSILSIHYFSMLLFRIQSIKHASFTLAALLLVSIMDFVPWMAHFHSFLQHNNAKDALYFERNLKIPSVKSVVLILSALASIFNSAKRKLFVSRIHFFINFAMSILFGVLIVTNGIVNVSYCSQYLAYALMYNQISDFFAGTD